MIKYVYICSAGHSGSTLLDLLLGSHSKVESLGEIAHLPKNIALNTECSCREPVQSCSLWKPVIANLGAEIGADLIDDPYALNTGYPKAIVIVDKKHQTPGYLIKRKIVHGLVYLENRYGVNFFPFLKKDFKESLDARFKLYDSVRKHQNVDVVVDSSKTYLEAIALYQQNPDEVRILLLSRDGRGVMYSNMKRKLGRRKGLIGWKHYYSRALLLLNKLVDKEHFLHVHYEDIAQNTANELKRICEYINLDFEHEMIDFTGHEHHITNGNDMRFSESSEIKLDTSWETSLSKKDRKFFERVAGITSTGLGYK